MPNFIDNVTIMDANGNTRTVIDTNGRIYPWNSSGIAYFVDANNGSNTNDGKSWDKPFLTMAKAFSVIASGDIIYFQGKIKEQLTTPVQVFDVTIVGAGNRPRHADNTPAGGELAANTWTKPDSPTAATPLCKVLQQGWRFINILFAGPTDAACVLLYRDGGASNAERDASHAEFHNCRFASGRDLIEQSGGCYNVGIYNCSFHDATGYALKNTAGAGIAAPYRWEIIGNRFGGNANLMGVWSARQFKFWNNQVAETTTNIIDFSGGSHNSVINNTFDIAAASFDPTGKVAGSTTDTWSNYLIDGIESGLPAD